MICERCGARAVLRGECVACGRVAGAVRAVAVRPLRDDSGWIVGERVRPSVTETETFNRKASRWLREHEHDGFTRKRWN